MDSNALGIFTYRNLLNAGYTRHVIAGLTASGSLTRLRKGWYAAPNAAPAVARAVELGGSLGCLSGCSLYGLWVPSHRGLHVIHGPGTQVQKASDVVPHWTDASQPHIALWPLRDCLAHVVRRHDAETGLIVVESAANRGLIGAQEARGLLCLAPARHGNLANYFSRAAESGSETRVRLFLQRRGVPVTPQAVIPGVGRVDLLVGDQLIVECDSDAHHGSPANQIEDRRRDLAARDLGYDKVRLSYRQIWVQWEATQLSLSRQLQRRRHSTRADRPA